MNQSSSKQSVSSSVPLRALAHPSAGALADASSDACGKAIICGEHAVIYGATAVAIPLRNLRLQLQLSAQSPSLTSQFILQGQVLPAAIADVITEGFNALGIEPSEVSVTGASRLPIGAGLGSSASLCIAMLRVISKATNYPVTPEELAELGNRLERRFHGRPSGLDTTVVAYEQPITFRRSVHGPHAAPLSLSCNPMRFALVDSGVRAPTIEMIKVAAPHFSGSKSDQVLKRADDIAQQVAEGLTNQNHLQVADAMTAFCRELKAAGVVSKPIEDIIATCGEVGTLAAKSTGAGGGGAVLALLDPSNALAQLAELIRRFGSTRVFSVEV